MATDYTQIVVYDDNDLTVRIETDIDDGRRLKVVVTHDEMSGAGMLTADQAEEVARVLIEAAAKIRELER